MISHVRIRPSQAHERQNEPDLPVFDDDGDDFAAVGVPLTRSDTVGSQRAASRLA